MAVSEKIIKEVLLDNKLVSDAQFSDAQKNAKDRKLSVDKYLFIKKILSEDDFTKALAKRYNVQTVDLKNEKYDEPTLNLIPEPIARRHKVVALRKKGNQLMVAMMDPEDLQTIEFIKKKTGFEVVPMLATYSGLDFALSKYHSSLKTEFEKIMKGHKEIDLEDQDHEAEGELEKMAEEIPVVRVVDTLLEYAIFEKASDIHIEPQEKEVMVRYRIDGVLHDVMTLPKVILPALIARIKVLSNLKIDEHRLPQDGRFKIEKDEHKISFRVSTIPVFDGEKIVMRLLEEGVQALTLEQLGFARLALEHIKNNLKKPHGMTLVTGPTGSGKSTTLYTVLTMLNTKNVNISTIEDPIEYRIPGVNQMQVNPKIGLTFAIGLRALLRQDPNIIMIGEIRDKETAEEAVHAAMTGHIVLSTLHTNNACGALPRLLDIGVEPYLIASTVNAVVGQRLTRKICQDCREEYKVDKEFENDLKKDYDLEALLTVLRREKFIENKVKSITELTFYKGAGCDKCGGTGYKGRKGIFEVLEVTPEIQDLILKHAPTSQIQDKAVEQGMIMMWEDGFIKCLQGKTTIEEILRVSKE